MPSSGNVSLMVISAPSDSSSLFHEGIVGIALLAAAMEGIAIGFVQLPMSPDAFGQVGIGDIGLAESDKVRGPDCTVAQADLHVQPPAVRMAPT